MIEVEKDCTSYGDELVFGGGKTARQGMGLAAGTTQADGALDHVITNVVVLDAILGVVKADIGIRNGLIAAIGKAGNPSTMDNVTENMVVSNSTEVTAGEGLIATAGFFELTRDWRIGVALAETLQTPGFLLINLGPPEKIEVDADIFMTLVKREPLRAFASCSWSDVLEAAKPLEAWLDRYASERHRLLYWR